jgi:hypothetical protein
VACSIGGALGGRTGRRDGGERPARATEEPRVPGDRCVPALLRYADSLYYAIYLATDCPIAIRVIEGDGHRQGKDQMAVTGVRRRLEGAEAVRRLRGVLACASAARTHI